MDFLVLISLILILALGLKSHIDTAPKEEWSECPGCHNQVWAGWCGPCEDGFCSF